jgi:hypothetical protein
MKQLAFLRKKNFLLNLSLGKNHPFSTNDTLFCIICAFLPAPSYVINMK